MKKDILLRNHLNEIKFRSFYLILSCFISLTFLYHFSFELIFVFIEPLLIINQEVDTSQLIYTNITEAFFSFFYLSLISMILFNIPLLCYHLYFFILPGLYKNEQRQILIFFFVYTVIFFGCFYLIYFFLIPLIWAFFLDYEKSLNSDLFNLSFQGKISEYIQLLIRLNITFLICFQLPIFLFLLIYLEIIAIKTLVNNRRVNIIIAFILGALFSPPDIISQILLAIPLCFFYEIIIFCGIFLSNRKNRLLKN